MYAQRKMNALIQEEGYFQPAFSDTFSEDGDCKDGHPKVQGIYCLVVDRDPQVLARPQAILVIHHYKNAV